VETLEERQARIAQLDARRASRREHAGSVWPTPDNIGTGQLSVEIAPGRGNLNFTSWGTIYDQPTALRTVGGRAVSFARIFQSQPWVAAAVMRMLTWAIRVPLRVYRMDSEDPNAAKLLGPNDHPLAAAIQQPWDRGNMAQLIMSLLGPVLVNGNSVTMFDQGASNAIQFMPKDWRFSQPIMPWRDVIEGFTFDNDLPAIKQSVSIDKVLHIAWWSPIGPIGTSPLQQLGVTINIEDAAQRYQIASFANGARPPSAITASEQFLGIERSEREQIMKNLRHDVTSVYGGPDRAGLPALLPPGLDWKPVGQTTIEAALIQQREFTREEIAAVYLIMPMMLGQQSEMNYSNLQAAREMTYTDALGPPLILIEQAINSQLVWAQMREPDIFVRFDFSAVLRGDRAAEIEAMRNAVSTGLFTPNEARSELDRPKSDIPEMDDFYLPLINNLAAVGTPTIPAPLPAGTPEFDPNAPPPPFPPQPPQPPQKQSPPRPPQQRSQRLHFVHRGREYVAS
jgi:HK97 family phage portal protein